jgi:hypothetical protein
VLSLSYFKWSSLISSLEASFMVIDDEGGENGTKMYMKNMIKGRRIMKD